MARRLRSFMVAGVLLIAACLISVWIVSVTPAFQECIKAKKETDTYSALRHNDGRLVVKVTRLRLNAACSARFVVVYHDAISTVSAVLVAIFTLTLWISTNRLWKVTSDQLRLAYPAGIRIGHIHIWTKGQGRLFGTDNKPPDLVPGDEVCCAVFAINLGQDPAEIIQAHCDIIWRDRPLDMNHPLWGRTTPPLRAWDWERPARNVRPAKTINAGEHGWWELRSEVPAGLFMQLYVVGTIVYRNRIQTRHHTFFARRYDRGSATFVAVGSPDYESETKSEQRPADRGPFHAHRPTSCQ